MKKNVWKLFINYEKEETWLNEMSAKGLAFTNFTLGRYSFTDCKPGEYVYRIELLNNIPSHPESQNYLKFMEESGAEPVSTWYRWVYFRKRSEGGKFEIYNDIDSKMAYFKRLCALYFVIGIVELCFALTMVGIMVYNFLSGVPQTALTIFVLGLSSIVAVVCFNMWNLYRKKIKKLKQEKNVWA